MVHIAYIISIGQHSKRAYTMIRVFNSAYRNSAERLIGMDEVRIVTQGICQFTAKPYILFEHRDYPLGALQAEFDGTYWQADMN